MADEYFKRTGLAAGVSAEVAAASDTQGLDLLLKFTNRDAKPTTIRVYFDTTDTPEAADYVEYDSPLLKGYPLTLGPFRLPPGLKAYARDANGTVSVVATGQKLRTGS